MIDILRNRRSIRLYKKQKVEQENLTILKEAVLRAPSSRNINAWEFIFVDKREIINQLKHCKQHGTKPLETAPLAIVICADENMNDVWIEDCSIASVLLQLTAHSLKLGSCWIQVRNRLYSDNYSSEKYIQEILQIPLNFRVLSIITIGHSAEKRAGKPVEELQFNKIRINRF